METNPTQAVRRALSTVLDEAAFNYEAGATRKVVAAARRVLTKTAPTVAHEKAVGIFKYDTSVNGFVQAEDEQAYDSHGNLRPGYVPLFKHAESLSMT